MKKILLILILLLCGCDEKNTLRESTFGETFWKTCIDGKEFIKGNHKLSINLDFDGKPIPCEERINDTTYI